MELFTYRFVSRVVLALGVSVFSLSGCLADTLESSSEGAGTNEEGITGSLPVGTKLKATGSVNLRSAPSTSASILTVVASGSTVTVQTATPSNGFYNISYNGTVGWSSGNYFEPASGGSSGSVPGTLSTTVNVNLRSGPSTSDSILTVIPAGTDVTVLKPDPVNGFYNVSYQKLSGWSSGKFLGPAGGSTTPIANGQVWKFRASTLSVDVAVFVPQAAAQASEVTVLFYSHGLNVCSPVAKSPPLSFVTDEPFHLAKVIDDSKRPIVLVAPFFDWENITANGMAFNGGYHKLGIPKNLNGVVAEVLSQVGKHASAAAPGLTKLVVAGHSKAYDFLNPLAAANADPEMSNGALAKLSQVWGLDTGYACSPLSDWTKWMAGKPSLDVVMDYRAGTQTASCGQQFASLVPSSNGQLAVHTVPEEHCAVPATELPKLIAAMP